MQRILSFDQTPPVSVPLRFFLTAPVFAIIASLLLIWYGPQALESRWVPLTLTLTHLLTLGFLATAMVGAVVQILPVVAGVHLPRAQLTAGIVHFFLVVGTAALAGAFLLAQPLLFKLALLFLGFAFLWLLGASVFGLWRVSDASATLWAIRLALIALLVTVILGATLASVFAWTFGLPLVELTDMHARWGLLGWVGLLV
ncbi:MAG: permease, partial [bacterium]